jgi:hypothetical protein
VVRLRSRHRLCIESDEVERVGILIEDNLSYREVRVP